MKLATSCIFVITTAAATSAFATGGMFVDSSTVREVQQTLMHRGFHGLRSDGIIMGPRTQGAIRDFQRSEHLQPTGQLNQQTLVALGIEHDDMNGAAPQPGYSEATMRKVQETLNDRGFKVGPANGNLAAAMQPAIRDFQKSENLEATGRLNDRTLAALGIEPESVPQDATLARNQVPPSVRDVQHELNQLGYDAGSEDGVIGHDTRAALRDFQRAQHLPLTGRIDERTLVALRQNGSVATR